LLRQDNGFEGLLPRSVLAHFHNLPVPILVHENFVNYDVGDTASGVATHARNRDHVLASIDVFLDLDLNIGKEFQPPSGHVQNGLMALKGTGLGLVGDGPPHDLSIKVRQPCIKVTAIESLGCIAVDLNVLLRHRPRSIPQAQESA